MKEKVKLIVLIAVFIIMLIVINNLLNNKNRNLNNVSSQIENKNIEEVEEMNILEVNSENFEKEVLESDKPVLIDFYADWCGPCKMLSPIVEEVATENNDVKVVKVNIDNEQDLAIKYSVMSIPTLIVIRNGEVANMSVGLISKEQILSLITNDE